ncbi:hypothetical protein [Hymenobacter sp. 102]|uniref:hypothetical protein n=1 Tax=Hymenobacter sp. 102 TaxID=3403152 RepID=UPI003CEB2DA2
MVNPPGNCPRCNGKGTISKYSYVQKGVCFRCKGTGTVELSLREEMKLAIRQARQEQNAAFLHDELRAELIAEARAANKLELIRELYPDLESERNEVSRNEF